MPVREERIAVARLPDHAEVESEPIRIERAGEPVVRVTAAPRRRG